MKKVIVRPTGRRINPLTGEGPFGEIAQTHYIVDVNADDKLNPIFRDVTSFGSLGLSIFDRVEIRHEEGGVLTDWSGGRIVGIRRPDGEEEGRVFDTNLMHWVVK